MDPQLIFASAEWLERLARELKRIRDERQAQLTALGDTFGDPRGLADCYVEPDVQHMNPADYDEDREPEEGGLAYVRTPAFTALNRFLRGSGHLRDGRNQFFPEGDLDPFGRPGRIEIGGYVCPMLYLSLFDDEQVERYLRRRYPDHLGRRLLARSNPVRVRAEAVVRRLRSLRFRPLLLARMDDILGVGDLLPAAAGRDPADGDRDWTAYRLYDALVNGWLIREEAKLRRHRGNPPTRQTLLDVCTLLAVQLQARGERHLLRPVRHPGRGPRRAGHPHAAAGRRTGARAAIHPGRVLQDGLGAARVGELLR